MLDVTLKVRLRLQGPILTRATEPGPPGVDAPFARTSAGQLFLPGTLVKGRLLDAWRELMAAIPTFRPDTGSLLGAETGNAEHAKRAQGTSTTPDIVPRRGRLRFSDFPCGTSARRGERHRVRIDEETGAAAATALQAIETPFAAGQTVHFDGTVDFFSRDQAEAEEIQRDVEAGLRWAPGFGSFRSIGFGRLLGVDITRETRPTRVAAQPATHPRDTIGLLLWPRSAFCVARHQPDGNVFESDDVIPGGVIKGCLARTWRMLLGLSADGPIGKEISDPDRQSLLKHFERVRFTHAFPAASGRKGEGLRRPVRAPLSLVTIKNDDKKGDKKYELFDVALCDGAGLISGKAPAFSTDWKDSSDVEREFGWTKLKRELRARTAIEPGKRRAAENQLFGYEMVAPEDRVWCLKVDLSRVDEADRAAVEAELKSLLALGLRGLGKTKAAVHVDEGLLDPIKASRFTPLAGSLFVVTLQTDALLGGPAGLNESSGKKELFDAYKESWKSISGSKVELVQYFANQHLAGGYYLHRRFQSGREYFPFFVTGAGSVFVLRPANGANVNDVQNLFEGWVKTGLPLPPSVKVAYESAPGASDGDRWFNCPYIPENGYGEIAVNLEVHEVPKGFAAIPGLRVTT